jgi:hypothetical protein
MELAQKGYMDQVEPCQQFYEENISSDASDGGLTIKEMTGSLMWKAYLRSNKLRLREKDLKDFLIRKGHEYVEREGTGERRRSLFPQLRFSVDRDESTPISFDRCMA